MHTSVLEPTSSLADASAARDLGGLLGLTPRGEVPFPLRLVRVRSSIVGAFARTEVEQTFGNPHAAALEAVHIFPLPPDGAVVDVELRCGALVVRAECREREAAERVFDEARRAGHRAGLLTAERPDVHTLRVTNIPPREDVTVRMVVIERLEESDGALDWRFPTVIAPRYIPGREHGHAGDGVHPDTDRVPDASRITPPVRLSGGTTLDLEIAIHGHIAGVSSSLQAVKMAMGDVLRVAPSTAATLNCDFVLRIEPAARADSGLAAFTDGSFTAVRLTPPPASRESRLGRDAVFVLDISGSMDGRKMEAGRRALKAAVRGLDAGDRFKLIAFNTSHECFTSGFVAFDDVTLAAADTWVDGLNSGGGTELLRPLLEALAGETPGGRLRTVLVITDGEVGNEDELAKAVARHRGTALVFTVGIDTAVNVSLLTRMARLGGGTSDLMTPVDDIEGRIAALEARLAEPSVWDVRIDGGTPAREGTLTLFAGRSTFALIEGAPALVSASGRSAGGPWHAQAAPTRVGVPLGALWARERVAWLEDQVVADPAREPELKAATVATALAHGIATRFTACVAVEETTSVTGERVTVVQPVELPAMWEAPPMMSALRSMGMPMSMPAYDEMSGTSSPRRPAEMPRSPRLSFLRARRESGAPPAGRPSAAPPERDRTLVGDLALRQRADGSVDGEVELTAALVVLLVALGQTRVAGNRRRVVQKAAAWLERHAGHPSADAALAILDRVESGGAVPSRAELYNTAAPAIELAGPDGWESILRSARL